MATPYDPSVNPYSINVRELPSNAAAAAKVPLWNTIDPKTGNPYAGGAAFNNWCYSPASMAGLPGGTWGSMLVPPNVTTTPVPNLVGPTPVAGWADAIIADRQATKVPTIITVETLGNTFSATHAVATPVTVIGYGFTGATAVNIGGACTAVTVVNDSTITCTTPAASVAGPANVTVTTPAGTGTLVNGFTYT